MAPYDCRAEREGRGYRWNGGDNGGQKAWWINFPECDEPDETGRFSREIYGKPTSLPTAKITAYTGYSEKSVS